MQFHFKNFKKKFSAFKFSPKLWDKPARTTLGTFLSLWSTQTFSALGSSMTSFALVIWTYEQSGSALSTALLSICSYAPYVLLSIFAGAAFRPLEQKGHHAHLRCRGGAHHRRRARFAQHRCALRVAPVRFERLKRPHQHLRGARHGHRQRDRLALPAPKSRTRVICNALLVSMSTENFLLALGHSMPVWCVGSVLGWLPISLMNANLDVLFRTHIPVKMQGRVYAARNSLPF